MSSAKAWSGESFPLETLESMAEYCPDTLTSSRRSLSGHAGRSQPGSCLIWLMLWMAVNVLCCSATGDWSPVGRSKMASKAFSSISFALLRCFLRWSTGRFKIVVQFIPILSSTVTIVSDVRPFRYGRKQTHQTGL